MKKERRDFFAEGVRIDQEAKERYITGIIYYVLPVSAFIAVIVALLYIYCH